MIFTRSSRKSSPRNSKIENARRRKLFFESLEERRVLATFNLSGASLTLGVNDNGSYGNGTLMANFNGVEFYYPGTPYHEIALAGNGSVFRNYSEGGITQIVGTSTNTSVGSTLSANYTGNAGGLHLVRDLSFNSASSLVTYRVQITNTTGSTITNVAFMDAADPDQSTSLGFGPSTNNDIVLINGANFVRASSPTTPLTVGFGSDDPRAVVSVEQSWPVGNPFNIINSPVDPNGAFADWAIGVAFNFGNLAPGQTVIADYATPFATSPAAADAMYASTFAETSVSLVGPDLVVTDINGGATNDNIRLSYDGSNIVVNDPGNYLSTVIAGAVLSVDRHTVTVPAGLVSSSIQANTLDGNDTLTVDSSMAASGKPITYNAGNPTSGSGDSMVLSGPGAFTNVTHTFANAADGSVSINGYMVQYFGLEPITDNLNAVNRVFTFLGGPEIVALSNSGGAADTVSTISSNLAESVAFINPTGSLTVNLNGGDTFNFNSLDSQEAGPALFSANLIINGVGGDTVNFPSAMINLGAGNANIGTTGGQPIQDINFTGGGIQTTGDVFLRGTGSILNPGAGAVPIEIVALNLVAVAGTGVNLDTTVANLEASGGSGGVDIQETNGLVIGIAASPVVGVSATGGNITVVAGGNMTVNENVVNSGGGNVSLTTLGSSGTTVVGGSLLLSQTDLNQLATWLGEGPLTLTNIFTKTTVNGLNSAAFHAAADGQGRTFSVMEVLATNGNPHNTIGGYNPQSWDSSNSYHITVPDAQRNGFIFNLTTSDLRPQKLQAIDFPVYGQYQTYNQNSYGPTFGGGHDIYVDNTLSVGSSYKYSYGTSGTFSPNIVGLSPNTINYGTIEVFTIANGGGGGVSDVAINANISATGGNGTVAVTATQDILHNSGTISAAGNGTVTETAGRHITMGATAQLQSNLGNITITADNAAGNNGGAITMADGSLVNTNALIGLSADGNIQLSLVQTTSVAGNAVTATTTSGAITDADNNAGLDISAVNGGAILSAKTGVGAAGSNATLEIDVINLDVTNTTSGGIFVTDVLGGLTLRDLNADGKSVNGFGGVGLIKANSPLTIASNATTSGGMTYTASDSAGAGDNLTINAGVTVTDTSASLTFNAGDNFKLFDTAGISAATSVTINIDAGNADGGTGATADINGFLHASTASLTGDTDRDIFNVTGPTATGLDDITAAVTVNGGGGVNDLNLSDTFDSQGVGSTATITHTTVEGFGGAPGIDYTYSNIANLDVTGTTLGDSITTSLGGAVASPTNFNNLVTVNVRGNGGSDNMFLHVADSLTDATLDVVNLFGDAGGDNFGGSAAGNRIRPVLATGQTQIIINGDAEAKLGPGPVNPGTTGTLTSPDHLYLDMTTTDSTAAVLPIVIVDTNGGYADAANTQSFRYNGIEDIDLYDNGVLTNTAIGDFYLRATDQADSIVFISAAQTDPVFRIRIGNLYYPTNGGSYGPYYTNTVAGPGGHAASSIFVYARRGNDTVNMYNTRLNAAFFGEDGDDILTGGYNNDLLVGGAGFDRLNGGSVGGNDTIWGDDFNPALDNPNVASQTTLGGPDTINTFGGNDIVYGQGGNDTINTGNGNDYVSGGAGNDLVDGQGGDDRIYGGDGDDVMTGSDGNDLVAGNDGNDTLYGRVGNDILIGGLNQDTLNGNEGSDVLVGDESNNGGSKSLSNNDAVDAALAILLANWVTPAPTPGNFAAKLGSFNSVGPDGSVDTLWGGTEADAFFGLGLLLDQAPDRGTPGNGPDLN